MLQTLYFLSYYQILASLQLLHIILLKWTQIYIFGLLNMKRWLCVQQRTDIYRLDSTCILSLSGFSWHLNRSICFLFAIPLNYWTLSHRPFRFDSNSFWFLTEGQSLFHVFDFIDFFVVVIKHISAMILDKVGLIVKGRLFFEKLLNLLPSMLSFGGLRVAVVFEMGINSVFYHFYFIMLSILIIDVLIVCMLLF